MHFFLLLVIFAICAVTASKAENTWLKIAGLGIGIIVAAALIASLAHAMLVLVLLGVVGYGAYRIAKPHHIGRHKSLK